MVNNINMEWENVGFVLASEYRKTILFKLKFGPKTPTQLANKTNLPLSHVSKTLKELTRKELTRCLTPNLKKGKIYGLTESGREILKKL